MEGESDIEQYKVVSCEEVPIPSSSKNRVPQTCPQSANFFQVGERYEILHLLGTGSFSSVCCAQDYVTGQLVRSVPVKIRLAMTLAPLSLIKSGLAGLCCQIKPCRDCRSNKLLPFLVAIIDLEERMLPPEVSVMHASLWPGMKQLEQAFPQTWARRCLPAFSQNA